MLGRAGLLVGMGGERIEVDSEMLEPPMTIAVYAKSVRRVGGLAASTVLDEVVLALRWMGFDLELIGQAG